MDLRRFEFDFDLTWYVFFLNAEETVTGRYGGRDAADAEARLSLKGLRYAMGRALEAHQAPPPARPLAGGPQRAEDFPAARRRAGGARWRRGSSGTRWARRRSGPVHRCRARRGAVHPSRAGLRRAPSLPLRRGRDRTGARPRDLPRQRRAPPETERSAASRLSSTRQITVTPNFAASLMSASSSANWPNLLKGEKASRTIKRCGRVVAPSGLCCLSLSSSSLRRRSRPFALEQGQNMVAQRLLS